MRLAGLLKSKFEIQKANDHGSIQCCDSVGVAVEFLYHFAAAYDHTNPRKTTTKEEVNIRYSNHRCTLAAEATADGLMIRFKLFDIFMSFFDELKAK